MCVVCNHKRTPVKRGWSTLFDNNDDHDDDDDAVDALAKVENVTSLLQL